MTISHFYLCAIPRVVWEHADNAYGVDIARFAADALGCERRIAKEVNLENEYSRYTLTCQRLEQEVARSDCIKQAHTGQEFQQILNAGKFPSQALHPGYLALLSRTLIEAGTARLGASFFLPDQVQEHQSAFLHWASQHGLQKAPVIRQRLTFLAMVKQADCGLLELQSAFHIAGEQHQQQLVSYGYAPAPQAEDTGQFIEIPDFATTGLTVEFFGKQGRKQHLAQVLRQQIRAALESGEAVTFGNQAPHDVITEVLHDFVFVPPGEATRPVKMRVAYTDGSETEPFPLFCLPQSASVSADAADALRVALMSMRHLELDPEIDFCWFRNREVSRTRTLAETDQFCLATTLTQLQDSLKLGNLSIYLYHTGFEPAVIGFYRGVVQTLLRLKEEATASQLSITPLYFRGGENYQAGTVWK